MAQPYISISGYYLYYDEDKYSDDKQAINYLYGLDASEIKTIFDAAYATGEASFRTGYGYDFKITYDYSNKSYTLQPK